jgi:hypothetical protein
MIHRYASFCGWTMDKTLIPYFQTCLMHDAFYQHLDYKQ